ncbi:hypothetical protein LUZ61_006146 [Rhynchospora tenuis]|uniref:TF-B3 domain-containing protein n=1 Tax=Rhynchospora tenuis TaxID=198213 RepID=A0AAD5ZR31_9POAL|nr:hypothetical protein LUZ61_006146 [Rhynchospora tenuis]
MFKLPEAEKKKYSIEKEPFRLYREKEGGQVDKEVEMRKRDCKKCCKWEKHFYWSHMNSTKKSFFKKMDASCLNQMDLPKAFVRNIKGRIAKNVELKGPSGNIWQVGVTKLVENFTFQSGWKDFVIANSVKANDLLVFMYNTKSSFEVQIFDPSGTDYVPPKKTRGWASKEAGKSKDPYGGDELKTSNDGPLIFSKGLVLTPAQKSRAIELFRRVKPGNKHYVALMTYTSVHTGRATVPAKFACDHLPPENKKAILHYKGHEWPLSITNRKGLYVYFSSGWKKFVNDNNLRTGDVCLFELMKNDNRVSFKVHISRY